jgi:hypothetical protein
LRAKFFAQPFHDWPRGFSLSIERQGAGQFGQDERG